MSIALEFHNSLGSVIQELKAHYKNQDRNRIRIDHALSSLLDNTINPLLNDITDLLREDLSDNTIKFVVFENVTKEHSESPASIYFIQILLNTNNQPVNPLTDSYFLIDGSNSEMNNNITFKGISRSIDLETCIYKLRGNENDSQGLAECFTKSFSTYLSHSLKELKSYHSPKEFQ